METTNKLVFTVPVTVLALVAQHLVRDVVVLLAVPLIHSSAHVQRSGCRVEILTDALVPRRLRDAVRVSRAPPAARLHPVGRHARQIFVVRDQLHVAGSLARSPACTYSAAGPILSVFPALIVHSELTVIGDYLLIFGISSPTHSFFPGLKPSFSTNLYHCSPSFLSS